ncbi:MAG: DUF4037 domain-containing protein [Oscillospiraceae bacterium]|nr:DUF4037 domain-containing protein [Oscillospiraceae bacterium]
MKGLELSRAYFEQFGRPMLEEQFPGLLPYLAVGLFGSGSECFGWDDELSRDHDFEPGFCIFLPEEELVDRRREFLLERAYAKLPKEFEGVKRALLQPVGGARHGVRRTAEFFTKTLGSPSGALTTEQWLTLPEQALAEATNGALFLDNWGEVSRIREQLAFFPEDVRLKKLAGRLLLMGQAGQYNVGRCLGHGESGAAQLAAIEFADSAMAAAFLLSRRYRPYYKWRFRALRELPLLSALEEPLVQILTTPCDSEKLRTIEAVCAAVAAEVRRQGLAETESEDLERLAYAVNDRVRDPELRNMHVLAAV